MADICYEIVNEDEVSVRNPSSRVARRKRMQIRRCNKLIPDSALIPQPPLPPPLEGSKTKRIKLQNNNLSSQPPLDFKNSTIKCVLYGGSGETDENGSKIDLNENLCSDQSLSTVSDQCPKFGAAAVCGRRREMEDAVSIHPSFCRGKHQNYSKFHFFGLYDGHGCSHVAMTCKERMHELVKEEIENGDESVVEWKETMERSFYRMDEEVVGCRGGVPRTSCRCDLQIPQCDAVGSTAVVSIVTPDKIVVANCGDSRAVLCRSGGPVPLSTDHKPDLPEEQLRIQDAGGRVIYWDGPRVLGVLAMSRAIGDSYLKPYVSSNPEITITERSEEDECLILASDGLWDVVSNNTACDIVRMCLKGQGPVLSQSSSSSSEGGQGLVLSPASSSSSVCGGENPDKACLDAAMLLTKLALARRSADNVSVVVVNLRRIPM